MDFIVRERGAVLVAKMRFVLSFICLLVLAAANAIHTAGQNPMRVLSLHILLLTGIMILFYLLPSVLFHRVWLLSCSVSSLVIGGTLIGMELSALGPVLLPLFILAIPQDWSPGKVLLLSIPALGACTILQDWASLLQLGLSLCAIIYLAGILEDEEEDEEQAPDPRKTHLRVFLYLILFLVVLGLLYAAKSLCAGRPVETAVQPMIWIASLLLVHFVLHNSMHLLLLPFDGAGRMFHTPASTIAATCLLNVFTASGSDYRWIRFPCLLGMGVLLARLYRCYEQELHLACMAAADQDEDDDLIQSLF